MTENEARSHASKEAKMQRSRAVWVLAAALMAAPALVASSHAQAPENQKPPPPGGLGGPSNVRGHVLTVEFEVLAPDLEAPRSDAAEFEALMQRLKAEAKVSSRFYFSGAISRQEILSTDFILPEGTLVLHEAGKRYYAIADPKAKTFVPMDSESLLNALEGGAGIETSQYDVTVRHTTDKKDIAGFPCRKSVVTVAYVSSIPFENERVFVQGKNDIEVWHTPDIPSSAALDHLFFKFQRDKTQTVEKELRAEVGFPMDMKLVVTQGAGTKKGPTLQPGSFRMRVTEAREDKALDPELFKIPPKGFKRVDKSPFATPGS
jgi:hypothetical protein